MFNLSKKFRLISLSLFILNACIVNANAAEEHVVVAPECLIKKMHGAYQTLATSASFKLITVNDKGINQLISAKNNRSTFCGGFMDVTQAWNESHAKMNAKTFLSSQIQSVQPPQPLHYDIKYETEVLQLFKQINPQTMWGYLTTLSNFQDRYANSDLGVKAADWFKSQVETIAKENNRNDVSVYFIATGKQYKQPSVVAKIGDSAEPGIVIGAHMDTLSGSYSKKPGADDDGSGSVTVLETMRTILSSGMTFKKPLYFVWYAAEEEGLVGSGYVVSEFKKKNIPVAAVLHFDLTGYAHNNEPTMWLIDDYVNKDLVTFLGNLITTYVKQPIKHTRCGYACSDHASWTQNGYAAAIPAESSYENTNPSMHTSRDTQDKLSLAHMTDYLKLATAFAVELAEPKG